MIIHQRGACHYGRISVRQNLNISERHADHHLAQGPARPATHPPPCDPRAGAGHAMPYGPASRARGAVMTSVVGEVSPRSRPARTRLAQVLRSHKLKALIGGNIVAASVILARSYGLMQPIELEIYD